MDFKCKCQRVAILLCVLVLSVIAHAQTIECPHCKNMTLLFLPPGETNQFVSCPCQHCNQSFEFDAAELTEENSLVPCPYCGQETKLFIPESESGDQIPQSVMELIRNGEKIAAIKELRAVFPGLLLSKAKQIVEEVEANSVTAAAEMLRQHKADLGASVATDKALRDAQWKEVEERANASH